MAISIRWDLEKVRSISSGLILDAKLCSGCLLLEISPNCHWLKAWSHSLKMPGLHQRQMLTTQVFLMETTICKDMAFFHITIKDLSSVWCFFGIRMQALRLLHPLQKILL